MPLNFMKWINGPEIVQFTKQKYKLHKQINLHFLVSQDS